MLLAMILGLSLAEAQESDNADENEDTKTSQASEEERSEEVDEEQKILKTELEEKPRKMIEKSLPTVILDKENSEADQQDGVIDDAEKKDSDDTGMEGREEGENSQDGVIGEVDEKSTWDKFLQTEDDFGLIFRPQLGFTTLQVTNDSYSGFHAGLNLGYKKYHRLKLANIGVYTRSRALFLPTIGDLDGSELRIGAVGGLKLSAFELEAGADLIRHSIGVAGTAIDYDPAIGIATPIQALINFEDVKVKVELEPRWYIGNSRKAIVWEEHKDVTMLPIQGAGDEFSWTVGARLGWFGLSYEQLHMNGGIQRVISWGLQR